MKHTFEAMPRTPGINWNQLRSEREDVCEALLQNATSSNGSGGQQLQARLREIDDALDRIVNLRYDRRRK